MSNLDFTKAVSYIVTDGLNCYISNEGHPTMCRSVSNTNVLCAGRFKFVDGLIRLYSTSGYLPNTKKWQRETVEFVLEERLGSAGLNFVDFEWVE